MSDAGSEERSAPTDEFRASHAVGTTHDLTELACKTVGLHETPATTPPGVNEVAGVGCDRNTAVQNALEGVDLDPSEKGKTVPESAHRRVCSAARAEFPISCRLVLPWGGTSSKRSANIYVAAGGSDSCAGNQASINR